MSAAGMPWPDTSATKMPIALLVDRNEVVEIARHRRHGNITGGNVQTLDCWDLARQNRQLNLSGGVHFALDSLQLAR